MTADALNELVETIRVFEDKHIEVDLKFIDETVVIGGTGNG